MLIKKLHVENYLSLKDVTVSFKPLTIIVGANASGKTNVLSSLKILNRLMLSEELPTDDQIKQWFWAGYNDSKRHLKFKIEAEIEDNKVEYILSLQASDKKIYLEQFFIGNQKIIDIEESNGIVFDEKSGNETSYYDNKMALRSAGAYGEKPITRRFSEFLKEFEFYNFMPEIIRRDNIFSIIGKKSSLPSSLDDDGSVLRDVLLNWHESYQDNFKSVNELLEKALDRSLECLPDNEEIGLQEGYEKLIPLKKASDGTLRLLAYYTLLNQDELPKLVAIEEPERNLHPAALEGVANLLQELSQRTQVIITTHSSQLLDALNTEDLGKDIEVVLLQNKKGEGTTVIDLNQAREKQPAFQGWIEDFGIGSAIFDSELI
jgi:predicted ATPase